MADLTDQIWEDLTAYVTSTFAERIASVKQLSHYTSFAALKSIVEAEEFWFSSATQMNDLDEIARGKELLIALSAKDQPLFELIANIQSISGAVWEKANQAFVENQLADMFHSYISCWTECNEEQKTHDDLTMWRGYASNGNGVAIVVDPLKLGMLPGVMSEIIACPIFYETDEQFADRAVKALKAFVAGLEKWRAHVEDNHFLVADAFQEVCFYLAVTHKHPGFSSEREWRFVWRKERHRQSPLQKYLLPRIVSGGLIEKFCFPIRPHVQVSPAPLDVRTIITSVMIGPCDDQYLKCMAVRNLLLAKGFQDRPELVTRSTIPFREVR